jgi:hypothetical protein
MKNILNFKKFENSEYDDVPLFNQNRDITKYLGQIHF